MQDAPLGMPNAPHEVLALRLSAWKGREALEEILHALSEYAQRHFSMEEDHELCGMAAHALEHRKFMDKVQPLIDQHENAKLW